MKLYDMNNDRSLSVRVAYLFVGLLCLAVVGCAGGPTTRFSPDQQATIESAVSKFMAGGNVPGVSVAVVQNREFVWSKGFGVADLENGVPATADTQYRLGSTSPRLVAKAGLISWEVCA
jgi:CubicO group peptidase (beta-lactamase class C family)